MIQLDYINKFYEHNVNPVFKGGRKNIEFKSNITNGTQLSAYIKFGCISVRESIRAFKELYSKQ